MIRPRSVLWLHLVFGLLVSAAAPTGDAHVTTFSDTRNLQLSDAYVDAPKSSAPSANLTASAMSRPASTLARPANEASCALS